METWIRDACRKRAYRQLTVWLLIAAVGVAWMIADSRYWSNFFRGPYTVSGQEISSFGGRNDSAKQFVVVTGQKVADTGIEKIMTETRDGVEGYRHLSAGYYALNLEQGILIVDKAQLRVAGELEPLPADVANEIRFDPAFLDLRAKMYPLYLQADNFRTRGYVALGSAAVFGILFWMFGLRAWRRAQDVSLYPVVQRMEAGSYPVGLALQVEREMMGAVKFKKYGVVVTENFVIKRTFFTFDIFQMNELLWVFKKVKRHYFHFIPIGSTYKAVLVFTDGKVVFDAREKKVDDLLAFIEANVPSAMKGYTKDFAKKIRRYKGKYKLVFETPASEL